MEFIYSAGVSPEIALCVEYLSWNKEQRLYMAWLRDMYSHFFLDPKWDLNSELKLPIS